MSQAKRALLSVVVPCFNEAEVIEATHDRLVAVLESLDVAYELIYIDDGSTDGTSARLQALCERHPHARAILLARNFGHQLAVTAGIDHARGDAVVLMDADLQDPPEVIPQMVEAWREGFHVVYGQREAREGETAFKLATAKLFYRLINWLSDTEIPVDTGDFRLMDRRVVEALWQMPERDRFVRGMVSWVGFRQRAVRYRRAKRFAGTTKYPLKKMLGFAGDAVLSFSLKPLRLATTLGFLATSLAMAGVVYALAARLFTSHWQPGWATLFLATTFLGGVQLICTGIIGEYVGRIYRENKRRPLYLVMDRFGFAETMEGRVHPPQRRAA